MAQVIRFLTVPWKTQVEFLAPGFSSCLVLAVVDIWRCEPADENTVSNAFYCYIDRTLAVSACSLQYKQTKHNFAISCVLQLNIRSFVDSLIFSA